ncbi:MAG TPA: ATP-binding protein [Bacteroides sp.]|nr:ATP-binding protein [Bacteroides sp.]
MSELIYQPYNKSEIELRNDFVIRHFEFQKLMNSIRADQNQGSAQHILIQGLRGMGKTTLLLRVYYEVIQKFRESGLVPVILTERQYGIRTLNELWTQIIWSLEEHEPGYSGLRGQIRDTEKNDEKYYDVLKAGLKRNKHRLLLLIDDFGTMLNSFSRKEHQRLREILITSTNIQIIGSSGVVLQSIFDYRAPFFEFFQLLQLKPLNQAEAINLVTALCIKNASDGALRVIQSRPGLLESIRILSGGSPRIMVVLYNLLDSSDNDTGLEYFQKLMDYLTPQYRNQMDELPAKQQKIVHALAMNWDGMRVSDMEGDIQSESKSISAQLNNLVKKGMVLAERSTGKNNYYQLNDRLFNIWYLMRSMSAQGQKKVGWLFQFLVYWYPSGIRDFDIRAVKEASRHYRKPTKEAGARHSSSSKALNGIKHLLLIEEPEKATARLETLMPELLEDDDSTLQISELLAFAVGRGLRHYVLKLFQKEEYQLKDRFRVLYYALLKIVDSEESAEFIKMGKELSEPVEAMVDYITQIRNSSHAH